MRTVRIALRAILFVATLALLHYVLPQHDIARITSTEVIRMDFSSYNRIFYAQPDSATAERETRDIRLINTERKKSFLLGFIRRDAEGVMVYRNEDTGWIWPPYFKFDSSDLQATAAARASAPGMEQWVVITHYGWRNRFLSTYPNATGIRAVDGPEVQVIPWFNIVFLAFLVAGYFLLRAIWRQFRERMIDPLLENAEEAIGRVEGRASATKGRIGRWPVPGSKSFDVTTQVPVPAIFDMWNLLLRGGLRIRGPADAISETTRPGASLAGSNPASGRPQSNPEPPCDAGCSPCCRSFQRSSLNLHRPKRSFGFT